MNRLCLAYGWRDFDARSPQISVERAFLAQIPAKSSESTSGCTKMLQFLSLFEKSRFFEGGFPDACFSLRLKVANKLRLLCKYSAVIGEDDPRLQKFLAKPRLQWTIASEWWCAIFGALTDSSLFMLKWSSEFSKNSGLPLHLARGVCETNSKKGTPDAKKNPSCIGFTVRPWSQKGPDHGVGVDPSLLKWSSGLLNTSLLTGAIRATDLCQEQDLRIRARVGGSRASRKTWANLVKATQH